MNRFFFFGRPNRKHIYCYEPLLSVSHFSINHTKIFKSYLHYSADTFKMKKKIGINKLYGKALIVKKF